MADVNIATWLPALTEATTLDGTEDMLIIQGGLSKRIDAANFMGDLQGVKIKKVTLNATQVQALNTPFTLIAAPGAGKMIDVLRYYYKFNFVSTAYTSNTSLQSFWGGSGGPSITSNTNFLGNTQTNIVRPSLTTTALNQDVADFEDQPIVLYAAGGNPAGGDCTIVVYIAYQIITL